MADRINTVGELIAELNKFNPDEPLRMRVRRGHLQGVSSPIRSIAGNVTIIASNIRNG